MDIQYILDGIECNPANKDEVEYIFDFTQRTVRELELSVDSLIFVREDYDRIKTWLATNGRFVGMPLDITYTNGTTIKYLLDFSDPATIEKDRSYQVKIIRYQGIDNFFDNAEGLSFGRLNWVSSDFTEIDYVIVPPNQFAYFISLAIATFSLAQELAKAIQEVAEGIADVVKATVPVGIPPAPDWGAIAVAVIKLAARIAYTIFIIIALVQVGTQLINLIFPIIRQFEGIKLKRLIEKGCDYLGFTLESTLLDGIPEATVLPVPLREKDPSIWKELFAPFSLAYTNGYPGPRDTIPTLGRAIAAVEEIGNARTKVIGQTVRIEQELYYEQAPVTGVPMAFNMQDELQNAVTYNTDQIFKRLVALYQVDPSDLNTFDDTKKSLYEISSEVSNSPGTSYELIKRYERVDIPFARGTRKGSLTFVEKAAKVFAQALDLFTGGSLASKIEARKDVLQISEQYFGVTKLLYMNGSRLVSNQNDFIGCQAIVNNYWYSKFIQNNQRDKVDEMPYAATEDEVFTILDNNYLSLPNGKTAEITKIRWSEKKHFALVNYNVRQSAVNEETLIINDGG